MKAHRWKLNGRFWECNADGRFSKLEDKSCCMGCDLRVSVSLIESAVGASTEDQFNYLDSLADRGEDNELLIIDECLNPAKDVTFIIMVILIILGLVFWFLTKE